MKQREKRRDQTIRHGERALRENQRVMVRESGEPWHADKTWAWFAKGKAVGCRCRRSAKGRPKQRASMCGRGGDYHPSVHERIAGQRLARAWLHEARSGALEDVEL